MAFDDYLAERVRNILATHHLFFEEKKMMGGLTFMVTGKMCVGIAGEKLMARIDTDVYEEALKKKHCLPMDFTGKRMKGFVFIEPEGIDTQKDLEYWVGLALEFNPKAKASKK